MVRVRVRLGYTMAICLVLQHQVSTHILMAVMCMQYVGLYPNKLKKAEMDRPEHIATILFVLRGYGV